MLTGFGGKLYYNGQRAAIEEAICIGNSMKVVYGRNGEVYAFGALALAVITLETESYSTAGGHVSNKEGFIFTSSGTIYNRKKLIEELNITSDCSETELMSATLRKYGKDIVNILDGEYMFMGYDMKQEVLLLARSWGNTALYYYIGKNFLAFATHPSLVVSMPGVPSEPNIEVIASLMCRVTTSPHETCWQNILKIEPAAWLEVNNGRITEKIWWRPSNISKMQHFDFNVAIEEFVALYQKAVKKRIPLSGGVAATLSGGLDSASVCALAAKELYKSGKSLYAYTSVPFYKEEAYAFSQHLTDESILAQGVAASNSNIIHELVAAAEENIIKSIQLQLLRTGEPRAAVANLYWINNIMRLARASNCSVLLTGQMGNSTVSYSPSVVHMFPKSKFFRKTEWRRYIGYLKWKLNNKIKTMENRKEKDIMKCPVLNQNYLQSKAFKESILTVGNKRVDKSHGKLVEAHMGGFDIWYHISFCSGVEVRDATMDIELMEFLLRLPDNMFFSDGMDRRVMRQGMRGILSDDVRLNRRRGQQAADIIPRLRKFSAEGERAIEYIEASALARELLNIYEMKKVLQRIEKGETNFNIMCDSLVTLLPGISAGLFLASQDTQYKISMEL